MTRASIKAKVLPILKEWRRKQGHVEVMEGLAAQLVSVQPMSAPHPDSQIYYLDFIHWSHKKPKWFWKTVDKLQRLVRKIRR